MTESNNDRRQSLIERIMAQHAMGIETLGTAIRRLRLEVTGLDQKSFAVMCNLSTRTLYQIEKDKGNPRLATLEAILRKFGLRLGLIQASKMPHTPTLGQPKTVSSKPARGAAPQRKSVGQA
jgi:DNA-binding XRE family transcriptional regulator